MVLFNHKTSKIKFRTLVPLAIVVESAAVYYLQKLIWIYKKEACRFTHAASKLNLKPTNIARDKKNREENWVEEITLNEAIRRLPDREKNIIDLRFFKGKTQMEVAEEVGISQAQVSRLEKNALKSMRNYLRD